MSAIISQLIDIGVKPGFNLTRSPEFSKLRATVVAKGGVKEQYYGMNKYDKDRLVWVIQWPGDSKPESFDADGFRSGLKALDIEGAPSVWYNPFDSAEQPRPALTAPLTEFANLLLTTTDIPESTKESLHKTYTDCYDAPGGGFTGGYWSTALNDPKLNWYYLGWKSKKHHTAYSRTSLFALELDNLAPYTAGGYALWAANLTQELSK